MIAITYLVLLFFMLFIEIIRKKQRSFDFLSWFHIIFALAYPFPAFLLEANFGGHVAEMNYDRAQYVTNIQTMFGIFIGYLCVLIGFHAKSAEKLGKRIIIKPPTDRKLIIFSVVLLLFSCLSIQIYGSQYGGVIVALTQTNLIRAGEVERGPLVFFKNFILASGFASYFLASLLFISKIKKGRLILLALFAFSVVTSFIAATLTSGRMPMINYFLGFYLASIVYTEKLSLSFTLPFASVMSLFMFYGKPFFFSLTAIPKGFDAVIDTFTTAISSESSSDFSLYTLMSNFVYPVHSLDAAFNTIYQERLFVDWYYGFASFIPRKLINIDLPERISAYNTEYIVGQVSYSIPTGFLAFGVYSMSWLGLIIVCLVFGWVGGFLQTAMLKHINDIYWMPFLFVLTLQVWADYQPSGDPEVFLKAYFWYFISTTVLLFGISKISVGEDPNKIQFSNNRSKKNEH